jgi:hypothetical protein
LALNLANMVYISATHVSNQDATPYDLLKVSPQLQPLRDHGRRLATEGSTIFRFQASKPNPSATAFSLLYNGCKATPGDLFIPSTTVIFPCWLVALLVTLPIEHHAPRQDHRPFENLAFKNIFRLFIFHFLLLSIPTLTPVLVDVPFVA